MKSIIRVCIALMLIVSWGCSNNKTIEYKNDDFILQTKGYSFSEDSIYIEFGGYFKRDFVQFYNNNKIVYFDTLTSDIHTSYAKGIAIKRESKNVVRVIINREHEQIITLETPLNFISIWADKYKRPQFEIRNSPVILE